MGLGFPKKIWEVAVWDHTFSLWNFQDILCPAQKAMAEDEKTPSATSAGAATPVLTLRAGSFPKSTESNGGLQLVLRKLNCRGLSINGSTTDMDGLLHGRSHLNMDNLGGPPPFEETSIWGMCMTVPLPWLIAGGWTFRHTLWRGCHVTNKYGDWTSLWILDSTCVQYEMWYLIDLQQCYVYIYIYTYIYYDELLWCVYVYSIGLSSVEDISACTRTRPRMLPRWAAKSWCRRPSWRRPPSGRGWRTWMRGGSVAKDLEMSQEYYIHIYCKYVCIYIYDE